MSCLDVMYQVYGPPQSYFAAAYSPYHPVRAGDSSEKAEGGRGAIWRMVVWGLTKRKKGKGEGEGKGWRGEDLGACDGERGRTASHLGAGLGRVRTPAATDGLRAASRAILSLRRFFRDFFFSFCRNGFYSRAAMPAVCMRLAGSGEDEVPGALITPCVPASWPQPRELLRSDILPAPWQGAPELPSGRVGRQSAGGLRRFPGLAEGGEVPTPNRARPASRSCRPLGGENPVRSTSSRGGSGCLRHPQVLRGREPRLAAAVGAAPPDYRGYRLITESR